ncbi:HipA domain-containing protein [Planctomycetota bacterium]
MSDGLSFHNIPIIIDNWRRDDTYEGVYPSGARVKDAYFSPKEPEDRCIKSNWRYLFKLSRRRFPWQFWCEIIAYRFGSIIGVDVPPVHIGYSKKYEQGVDTYAALIEWFYDYKKDGYVSGGQIMVELIENFDRDTGKEHNLETIRQFFSNHEKISEYWAKILTFDTLIGNLDRHQDNWGFIIKERSIKKSEMSVSFTISPAFDNGTALGYEILEQKIENFDDAEKLQRYLTHKKASHHMKWSLAESKQLNFYEFMKKFIVEFPETKPIIAQHLRFTYQQIEEVLAPLVEAVSDPEYKLTRKRLDFVLKLIFNRKRILEETLEL